MFDNHRSYLLSLKTSTFVIWIDRDYKGYRTDSEVVLGIANVYVEAVLL